MSYISHFASTIILIMTLSLSSAAFAAGSIPNLEKTGVLPNIVFIWIDTLRADSLGSYGYTRNTSPNIDNLAKESVVFKNNFTPHTVTLSSFMSIITGLYPFSHGVLHIAKDKLSKKIKTLAEILKIHGYSTYWYGPDDPHLDPKVGFGRGFDFIGKFDKKLAVGRTKILKTIEQNKKNPFFLNFHSYHVHSPYIPSEKYKYRFTVHKDIGVLASLDEIIKSTLEKIQRGVLYKQGFTYKVFGPDLVKKMASADLFHSDHITSTIRVVEFLKTKNLHYKYDEIFNRVYESSISPAKKETIEYAKALYDAEILEFDTEIIGPVIEKLKELGIYDDTMIIICSDHGEEFGEHGGTGHGKSLYDEVARVPLIIKIPGSKKGIEINELSQTVDIMPTVLSLLNIPTPHHSQGISFSPLINSNGEFTPRKYIYGQMPYFKSIRSKIWKFHVFRGYQSLSWLSEEMETFIFGSKQLFNLQKDPKEQINLYSKEADIRDELKNLLNEWDSNLIKYQDNDYSFDQNIDAQTKEKIKKTGYW